MSLLLGIDLGTSYFKVGLYDERGALQGLGRVAVDKVTPAPGRIELPVENFWSLLRHGLAAALAEARATASEIAAVSYASQANTFVLVDAAGAALTPLILWTDTRAGELDERLRTFSDRPEFQATTGASGLARESAVNKWQWFQRHEPAVAARARWLMTISDYFTFALTGEAAGDASTAALLGAYDLAQRRWWPEALAAYQLRPEQLATPLPPGSNCGRTLPRATSLLGVPAGMPVAVGGLDHHVAAIGSGLDLFADASISTGTVLAAICLANRVQPLDRCFHGPHADGSRLYRLAFDPAGTTQLDDFCRQFTPDRTIEQLIELAATVTALDASAPAADQPPAVAVRTLLEKIGGAQRDLVRRITGDREIKTISATGGGARSRVWLGLQAEIMGTRIVTPAGAEPACLGAATFAAAAIGAYANVGEAARAMVRPHQTFEPKPGVRPAAC